MTDERRVLFVRLIFALQFCIFTYFGVSELHKAPLVVPLIAFGAAAAALSIVVGIVPVLQRM